MTRKEKEALELYRRRPSTAYEAYKFSQKGKPDERTRTAGR